MTAGGGGRRAVLHLGMHKTGTTALQETFQGYRDHRIAYADLGEANHSRLLAVAFDPEAKAGMFDSPDPADRAAAPARARARLDAALAVAGPRSVILSGEQMWALPSQEAVSALVAFLRDRGLALDALAYLRPPGDHAASAFQQRVQSGLARFDPEALVPPYRARAERWEAELGRLPELVLYDRAALRDGDVRADFAHRLGLDPAWARRRPPRDNASLSAEATAALFLLRRADGAPDRWGRAREVNGRLVAALAGFGRRRLAIDPDALAPVLAGRRDDLGWIEERLGRAFPAARTEGAALVGSGRDVVALGRAQEEALAAHIAAGPHPGPPDGPGVEGLLRGLRGRLEAEEARADRPLGRAAVGLSRLARRVRAGAARARPGA